MKDIVVQGITTGPGFSVDFTAADANVDAELVLNKCGPVLAV